jgi:hypothetical protein
MYLVIPTIKGYEVALKMLQESIPVAWRSKIIYVYQKESEDSIQEENGCITVKLKRNIYEYANWIAAQMCIDAKLVKSDEWFLFLHDTCKFGPRSQDLIEKILGKLAVSNTTLFWLSRNGQANICLIRQPMIAYGYDLYKSIDRMTKEEAVQYEWKWLKQPSPLCPKLWPNGQAAVREVCELKGDRPIYGPNLRSVGYFHAIDLEKYYYELREGRAHIEAP